MNKRQISTINFNMVIGKDNVGVGGLQLSEFVKSTTIPFNSENGGVAIKPSDFFEADFRLLSSTIVGVDSWKCCDFSKADLLKNAIMHFDAKPVYTEHDKDVRNCAGVIKKVWFDAASVMESGVSVPAGINGTLAIDTTSKEGMQLARSIAIGAIFSCSVGVEFEWTASHSFDDAYSWYENVGVIQKDGTMCRRIAEKIVNVNECSLVHLGADPFAKLLDKNGKIVNPDYGDIGVLKTLGLSKDDFEEKMPNRANNYTIICGYDEKVFHLAKAVNSLHKENEIEISMTKELLCEKFGLDASKYSDLDAVTEYLKTTLHVSLEKETKFNTEIELAKKQAVDLKAELDAEKEKVVSLSSDIELLKPKAEKFDAQLEALRSDAETKYRSAQLAKGLTADETIISLLKESDNEKISSLMKSFDIQLTESLDCTCTKCGSKEITFRSSKGDDKGGPDDTDDDDDFFKMAMKKGADSRQFLTAK